MEQALEDICFPLHNNYRYMGNTSIANYFNDLVKAIGSNKMKISGDKIYLIKHDTHPPKETDEKSEKTKKVDVKEEEEGSRFSKAIKFISNLKEHLWGFSKDEDSNLKGKYAVMNTQKKLWPIHEVFGLKKFMGLRFKSRFPLMSLRNYFGPKIALYFFFLAFFINRLYIIGIVGVIVMALYTAADMLLKYVIVGNQDPTDPAYDLHAYMVILNDVVIWLFSVYLFIWGFRFGRDWEINEKIFQINNGDIQENKGNIKDEERIKIKDYHYTRSFITDEMNTKTGYQSHINAKFVVVILLTILMGFVCLGLTIQSLELKHYLVGQISLDNVIYIDQQAGTYTKSL